MLSRGRCANLKRSYDRPVTTLEDAAAHWREWFDRGEFDEGAARVAEALNAPGADAPSVDRVRVLYGAHLLAFRRGEPSAAYAQECLDLARRLGDVRGECDGLTGLAREALRSGDYPRAADYAAEGLRRARAAGDRAAEGPPLHLYAAGTRLSGDYDRARELYLESVALGDELGTGRTHVAAEGRQHPLLVGHSRELPLADGETPNEEDRNGKDRHERERLAR